MRLDVVLHVVDPLHGVDERSVLVGLAGANLRWDARQDRVRGSVLGHHRVGADRGALADGDGPQHLRAGADHHPVADGGVALALHQFGAAERHTVVEHDVIADLGGLTDDHTHAMVDKESTANGGARVDLNAGEPAGRLANDACDTPVPALPQCVGYAVRPDGVQAGVHNGVFYVSACRWVVFAGIGQVFADASKNAQRCGLSVGWVSA